MENHTKQSFKCDGDGIEQICETARGFQEASGTTLQTSSQDINYFSENKKFWLFIYAFMFVFILTLYSVFNGQNHTKC